MRLSLWPGHSDDFSAAVRGFLSHQAYERLAPNVGEQLVVCPEPLRGSGSQKDGTNVPHSHRSACDLHDFGENRDGNFSWPFCANR